MLVWLILPFYDFCGFRSVAVNSVYKLQFFTFILYSAIYYASIVSKCSDTDHTVLPANTLFLHFLRERSPDGATLTEVADIQLQLTTHRPQRGKRLSWPGWLTYSRRFTHINGHPSATGRAQNRKSSPAKDRRLTAVPRNQVGLENAVSSPSGSGRTPAVHAFWHIWSPENAS